MFRLVLKKHLLELKNIGDNLSEWKSLTCNAASFAFTVRLSLMAERMLWTVLSDLSTYRLICHLGFRYQEHV